MAKPTADAATTHAVLIAGDAIGLGHAEVSALEAVDGHPSLQHDSTTRFRLTHSRDAAKRAVQGLAWGDHWSSSTADEAGFSDLATQVPNFTDGRGSVAVRVTRFGEAGKGLSQPAARKIGAALAATGHTVDLRNPDLEVYVWIGDGESWMGILRGSRDAAHEDRVMERRSHFSPIGMHPRRAASLVHLTRVAPGGRILDPFCGTGGIVIEAAAEGYDAWGSDLDPWMVQGTLQALTDSTDEPLDAHVFQADIGAVPELVEGIAGIATDMPYGKASTTDREALSSLYERALNSFAAILPAGGLAVIGHMDPELLANATGHGFDVAAWGDPPKEDTHSEYVHGSMTRHYTVLRRR